jgi:hypothetical protein
MRSRRCISRDDPLLRRLNGGGRGQGGWLVLPGGAGTPQQPCRPARQPPVPAAEHGDGAWVEPAADHSGVEEDPGTQGGAYRKD